MGLSEAESCTPPRSRGLDSTPICISKDTTPLELFSTRLITSPSCMLQSELLRGRVVMVLAEACQCFHTKLLDVEQLGWGKGRPLPPLCSPAGCRESWRKEAADLWESWADGSDRPHAPDLDRKHTKRLINKCRLMECRQDAGRVQMGYHDQRILDHQPCVLVELPLIRNISLSPTVDWILHRPTPRVDWCLILQYILGASGSVWKEARAPLLKYF